MEPDCISALALMLMVVRITRLGFWDGVSNKPCVYLVTVMLLTVTRSVDANTRRRDLDFSEG